jgi:hypothetical protein
MMDTRQSAPLPSINCRKTMPDCQRFPMRAFGSLRLNRRAYQGLNLVGYPGQLLSGLCERFCYCSLSRSEPQPAQFMSVSRISAFLNVLVDEALFCAPQLCTYAKTFGWCCEHVCVRPSASPPKHSIGSHHRPEGETRNGLEGKQAMGTQSHRWSTSPKRSSELPRRAGIERWGN